MKQIRALEDMSPIRLCHVQAIHDATKKKTQTPLHEQLLIPKLDI